MHGLGGLSGEIALWEEADLVADEAGAAAAARALGAADVLLPRGNGAVCTGADLPAACARAWFLEERARVALAAGPSARPLEGNALSARSRHHPTETARAWQWLVWRFPEATDPTVQPEGDPP